MAALKESFAFPALPMNPADYRASSAGETVRSFVTCQIIQPAAGDGWSVGWLFEAQQFGEQDRFVTAWASTSQTQGMTKQPALWTTSVTERAFAAHRALVQRVRD